MVLHFLFILVGSHLILLLPTLAYGTEPYNVLICRWETAHWLTIGTRCAGAYAGSDHGSRPVTPRLDTTSHDQGGDYEGLKNEKHNHTYSGMNSESEERGGDSEDQRQEVITKDQSGGEDIAAQD